MKIPVFTVDTVSVMSVSQLREAIGLAKILLAENVPMKFAEMTKREVTRFKEAVPELPISGLTFIKVLDVVRIWGDVEPVPKIFAN